MRDDQRKHKYLWHHLPYFFSETVMLFFRPHLTTISGCIWCLHICSGIKTLITTSKPVIFQLSRKLHCLVSSTRLIKKASDLHFSAPRSSEQMIYDYIQTYLVRLLVSGIKAKSTTMGRPKTLIPTSKPVSSKVISDNREDCALYGVTKCLNIDTFLF